MGMRLGQPDPSGVPGFRPMEPAPGAGYAPAMPRPAKLDAGTIEAFLSAHEGWARAGGPPGIDAIARAYSFADFSAELGFVVRVGGGRNHR